MKVLVTGSSGLLGTALRDRVGDSSHAFTFVSRQDADLENKADAGRLLDAVKPDAVLHLAAVVGGIKLNMERPEDLRDRNRRINENVLSAARAHGVSKVVSILSTCIFPENAPEPWEERMIHDGEPDRRQWGYAQAKRELDLMSRSFFESAGRRYVTLMPSTLYGPNDNFDPEKSHVISAVIYKIHRAEATGETPVFWGSGAPRREFLFVDDMARILLWALDHYSDPETLIVAPPTDASVREVVDLVRRAFGYSGEVGWDATRPDGRLTRRTHRGKFQRLLPDFRFTDLDEGLQKTVHYFKSHYPRLRGLGPAG